MPQPAREALEELQSLVSEHKWWRNGFRVNLDREESHRRRDRNGREWLKYPFAPRSNTIREGPILECVQKQLGPHINAVCLNKKSAESPPMTKHTDGKNAGPSWVCLWGDFEDGGELCLEDGTVYAEKTSGTGQWRVVPCRTGCSRTPRARGTRQWLLMAPRHQRRVHPRQKRNAQYRNELD